MSAKEAAISDIKSELHKANKVFLAYNPRLDSVINQIEKDYINHQKSVIYRRKLS